jgi:hypothetical protein
MGKKKSLGSSPIGFQSDNGSMNFIPDLGVAEKKEEAPKYYTKNRREQANGHPDKSSETNDSPEKKIVSYNLEKNLIQQVKDLANKKDMYYSTLVSKALRHWIAKNT